MKCCFFVVVVVVSKIFSPHYTGVGSYLIVSRMTIFLYLRYYNFSTTGFNLDVKCCFFVVVVVVVVDGFCCYKFVSRQFVYWSVFYL